MREKRSFQLADEDGEVHEYSVLPHRASDGLRLASRLAALAGPALGELLGKATTGKLGEALEHEIDWPAIVRQLATAIVAEDVGDLAQQLCSGALRDKVPLKGAIFDSAFQANYGELIELLVKVVEVNRFFSSFNRIGGKLSMLLPSPPVLSASSPPATPSTP